VVLVEETGIMILEHLRQPKILSLGIFLFLLISQAWLSQYLAFTDEAWIEPPAVVEKWDPRVYQLLSFGNLPVAIDWLMIQSIADVVPNKVASGAHSALFYRLNLITELDPQYFDIYQIAGDLLTVYQNDGEGAKSILLKGREFLRDGLASSEEGLRTEYWSRPWKIPLLLAYTYLFHLDDMEHASEAFQEAAAYPGAPEYLIKLEHRLKHTGGLYEVGIRLLGFMIDGARLEVVREKLERKRKDLFIAQYVYELNQNFWNYLKLQPLYNASGSVSRKQMETYFKDFLRKNQTPRSDPWGGQILIDEKGKIVTTTPYQPVFGLK